MPRKKKYDEDGVVVKGQKGRPKKDEAKNSALSIRLTAENRRKLDEICDERGLDITSAITSLVVKEHWNMRKDAVVRATRDDIYH